MSLLGELRRAARSLRRAPGVALPAILSLALGIGATTSLVGALDAFVLRPPPRLRGLVEVVPAAGGGGTPAPAPTLAALDALRRAGPGIELAAYAVAGANLGGGDAEFVAVAEVSDGFFRLLRARPLVGGLPAETGGPEAAAVIGEGLWRRRFGGRPDVVGEAVSLDGRAATVVGVLPREFNFPASDVDVWVRLPEGAAGAGERAVTIFGRLAHGASPKRTEAELSGAWAAHAAATAARGSAGVRLETVHERLVTDTLRRAGWIGIAAALLVLVIGCANVANLLLARALERRREMAIRAALGAGGLQLARQALAEGLLLALAGGVLGTALAALGTRGLELLWSSVPDNRPFPAEVALSGRFLLVALAASGASAVLFGLVPALESVRAAPRLRLTDGGPASTVGRPRARLQRGFVVAQLALACLLLASATLLAKSFVGLHRVDLGFGTEGVTTFGVTLPEGRADGGRAFAAIAERVREIPGVRSVGGGSGLPLEGPGPRRPYSVEGRAPPAGEPWRVSFRPVLPGYFETLRIPLRRGRAFTPADREGAPPVVVVNESLARRHWPGRDPLGERLTFDSVSYEVVGVVGDTREWGPHSVGPPQVYASARQTGATGMRFLLRSSVPADRIAAEIRAAVASVSPDLGVSGPKSMREVWSENTARSAVMARAMAAFALLALLLAAVGVAGVVARSVARRLPEMGIRRALGATPGDVFRMILGQGVRLVALGGGAGLLLAAASTRVLSRFLAGVSPTDPLVFAGVLAALAAAALLACLIPARRAARVEPVEALRHA